MNKITVKEWIEKFNNGEFDKADYETQCAAGWYDWFCSDYALAKRLKRMILFWIIIMSGLIIMRLVVILYTMTLDLNHWIKIKENAMKRFVLNYILLYNADIRMEVNICMRYAQQGTTIPQSLNAETKRKY